MGISNDRREKWLQRKKRKRNRKRANDSSLTISLYHEKGRGITPCPFLFHRIDRDRHRAYDYFIMTGNKKVRHDWYRIRDEYITGDDKISQEHLSQKYAIAKSLVSRRSASEKWVLKREQFRVELSHKVKSELIKRHSAEILKTADFLQVVRTYYKKHVFRRDGGGKITDVPEDSIPVDILNDIMTGIEKNVKLTRLIIGESTEVISTPESWEEKVKRLRAERGVDAEADPEEALNVAEKCKVADSSEKK